MYLFLDTETGGIGLDKSLLSLSFLICDKQFNDIASLDLYLKPNDDVYLVTAEALSINQINLISHDRYAIPYRNGGTKIYKFLKEHSKNGSEKLIPVGHGVNGDLRQIWEKLLGQGTWDVFVSYHFIDTCSTATFLSCAGKLPQDVHAGLGKLGEYFGLSCDDLHTAAGDVKLTKMVLKKMFSLLNS